jgi:hypothetical protein
MDALINGKIDRQKMIENLKLDADKPVVLFAPSWGGKYSKQSGIWNAELLKNIPNLIVVPHTQDYRYAKKLNAILPSEDEGINPYLQLADVIKKVLASAIEQGGTTLKDFVQADGQPGYFSQQLLVYGRDGENCDACLSPIKSVTIGQRNTFYCDTCQR